MMMTSYNVYLAVAMLLVSTIDGRVFDDDSIRMPNKNNDDKLFVDGYFIDICLESPKEIILQPGKRVELSCVAIGKPVPTIQWILNNNPHNIIDQLDSDMVPGKNADAMGRIRSRLIIEHSSASERTFTCVGRAGEMTTNASTTILSAPGYNKTELLSMNSGAKKAHIVYYNTVLFDAIGSDIMLPCKAAGLPNPQIYWLDVQKNVINGQYDGQYDRIRVHSSGSLMISSFEWSDMGVYTCIATNAFGADSIQTFLYALNGDFN